MSVQAKTILQKAAIYGGAIIILAIFQTAFFSRFAPFGATPDLMLAAVLAIAMFEGERAGCIAGIGAGFFIEAIGSVGLSILPVFYLACGAAAGLLCIRTFSRGPISYAIFVLISFAARAMITLVYINFFWGSYSIIDAVREILVPEYLSGIVLAFFPFIVIRLLAKLFHRTRELNR